MENPLSIEDRLIKLVAEQLAISESGVTLESSFEYLGADALDMMSLVLAIEDEFGVKFSAEAREVEAMRTVSQAVDYIKNLQALSGSPA